MTNDAVNVHENDNETVRQIRHEVNQGRECLGDICQIVAFDFARIENQVVVRHQHFDQQIPRRQLFARIYFQHFVETNDHFFQIHIAQSATACSATTVTMSVSRVCPTCVQCPRTTSSPCTASSRRRQRRRSGVLGEQRDQGNHHRLPKRKRHFRLHRRRFLPGYEDVQTAVAFRHKLDFPGDRTQHGGFARTHST